MERIEKLNELIIHLYNTYTTQTFNPKGDFQKMMMFEIIKHEAIEYSDLNNLNDIELKFIQLQVQTLDKVTGQH